MKRVRDLGVKRFAIRRIDAGRKQVPGGPGDVCHARFECQRSLSTSVALDIAELVDQAAHLLCKVGYVLVFYGMGGV